MAGIEPISRGSSVPRRPELITRFMARAKPKPKKEPLVVRSFTLTPAMDKTLQCLSQDASDHTGWTVSTSAVVRSILRYVEQQPASWALSYLFPLVEREIQTGVVW